MFGLNYWITLLTYKWLRTQFNNRRMPYIVFLMAIGNSPKWHATTLSKTNWYEVENDKIIINKTINIHENILACLFSVHNTISLSRHGQVCLIKLLLERYFSRHWAMMKWEVSHEHSLIKHTCSWRDKIVVL